jgi:hypothetical protein
MNKNAIRALAAGLAIALCAALQAEPAQANVSEKQPLAIFALGYYGWDIPAEALGSVDARIMEVFTRMKRFSIIGFEQRFSSADVSQFIKDIKKIKEENLVIPEKYLLGEAFLTDAEMNKLIGAFYIVMPVVTNYAIKYDPGNAAKNIKPSWRCAIDVSITFQDVARGVTMAAPVISASGVSVSSPDEAAASAISAIPGSIESEARQVFPLDSKIVSSSLTDVKMRLGANMGVKKGYEFAVIDKQVIDGIIDEREVGLVLVRDVTSEFSNATILYSSIPLAKETQLREVPRAGIDSSVYASVLYGAYPVPVGSRSQGIFVVPGLKTTFSEGNYDLKPFIGLQTFFPGWSVMSPNLFIPVAAYIGGEYNLYLRRFQFYPFAAVGANLYVLRLQADSATRYLPTHVGALGGLGISYLAGKSFKIYVEANGQYWQTLYPGIVNSIYGYGGTIGITAKL